MADIRLIFGVDTSSKGVIDKGITKIVEEINAKPYKIKFTVDETSLTEFQTKLQGIVSQLGADGLSIFSASQITMMQSMVTNIEAATGAMNKLLQAANAVADAEERRGEAAEEASKKAARNNNSEEAYRKKINTLLTRGKNILLNMSKAAKTEEYETVEEAVQELKDALKNAANEKDRLDQTKLDEISNSFSHASREIKDMGLNAKSLSDSLVSMIQKFGTQAIVSKAFAEMTKLIKEAVKAAKELDSALAQIEIVTGTSGAALNQFAQNAAASAKQVGASVTEVVASAETYARLGLRGDDPLILSEITNKYANVAATTVDEATSSMTSIMKAFSMSASEMEFAADVLTKVGQDYAISAAELGEAFQNGGAALEAGGNTFEQSAALFAAGNAAIQNASTVGNALKTTSMRIRSSVAELEEAGEEVDDLVKSASSYREEILALSGVDIMKNDTEYKSTYDILLEIAKVWDSLSDINQATLLEDLAGKRNANVIKSVITNVKDLEGAYEAATNASGTLATANEIYLETLDAQLSKFKAAWQTLAYELIDTDILGTALDAITGIVSSITALLSFDPGNIIDKVFGTDLNGALDGLLGDIGFFTASLFASNVVLETLISLLGKATKAGGIFEGKLSGLTKLLTGLSGAKGWIAIISAALVLAYKLYDYISKADERAIEAGKNAQQTISNIKSEVDDLKTSTDNALNVIDELGDSVKVVNGKVTSTSLTSNEMEDYVEACNTLAELYPELIQYYDADGNAVLKNITSYDELTKKVQELYEAQRLLANQEIVDNLPTVIKGIATETKNTVKELNSVRETLAAFSAMSEDSLSAFDISDRKYFSEVKYLIDDSFTATSAVLDWLDEYADLYDLNIKRWYDTIGSGSGNYGNQQTVLRIKSDSLDASGIQDMIDLMIRDFQNAGSEAGAEFATTFCAELKNTQASLEQELASTWSQANASLLAYLETSGSYQVLTNNSRNIVQALVNNMDWYSMLGENFTWDEMQGAVDGLITEFIEHTDSALRSQIASILLSGVSDLTIADVRTIMQSIADSATGAYGADSDSYNAVMEAFNNIIGYADTDLERLSGDAVAYCDKVTDAFGKTDDAVNQFVASVSDMSIGELEQFTAFMESINGLGYGDLSSFDGFLTAWDTYLNGAKDSTSPLITYSGQLSDVQETVTSLSDALTKLSDGEMTLAEVIELITQFPDLAEYVDLTAENFGDLDKGLKVLLRRDVEGFVNTLKEFKETNELTEEAAQAIDDLCAAALNSSADAITSLASEYITMADAADSAKRAISELEAAMSENPNSGYETRAQAYKRMGELFDAGLTGSASEIWEIAEGLDFAQSIIESKNDELLYETWKTKGRWFSVFDENLTPYENYEAIENFLEDVTNNERVQNLLDEIDGVWNYKDGYFEFDVPIIYWDELAEAIEITREELQDLMMEAGQYIIFDYETEDDLLSYMREIGESEATAEEKLLRLDSVIRSAFGDAAGDIINLDSLDELELPEDASETLGNIAEEYFFLRNKIKDPLDIKASIDAGNTLDTLRDLQEEYWTIVKPSKDGTVIPIDGTELEKVLVQCGYAETAIDEIVAKIDELDGYIVLESSANDPLGLNSISDSVDDIISMMRALGISVVEAGETLSGTVFELKTSDLETAMEDAGYTPAAIEEFITTLNANCPSIVLLAETDTTEIEEIDSQVEDLPTEIEATFELNGSGEESVNNVWKTLKQIDGTRTTATHTQIVNTVERTSTSTSGSSSVGTSSVLTNPIYTGTLFGGINTGSSDVSGTAHATGSWGATKTERALTGELGPEILVRDGRWYVVGDNGAEFTDIKKGDIIFNPEQSKSLLENGYVVGRGRAYATGSGMSGVFKSYSSGRYSSSSSSPSSSSFEDLYNYHQHLLAMEQETVDEYLEWLDEAYQKAYKNGEIELEDFYQYQEEVFGLLRDLFQDWIDDQSHLTDMLGHYDDSADEIIDIYTNMMAAIEKEIAAAYAAGLDDNSDYIQDLQSQWWDAYDEAEKLREDTTDDARDAIEELVDYRIDMIKKELEEEKDSLNEQLDALSDFYSKQKKMLQDSYDEETYLEDQAKKRKAVSDIEAEIAELAFDNSAWAQKRKLELEEELAEAKKDLADFERQYSLEVVQDMLDARQEAQEAELENEIDAIDSKLDDEKALRDQAIEDIRNGGAELYQEMIEWNSLYGSFIESDITDMWREAYVAAKAYFDLFDENYLGLDIPDVTGYEQEKASSPTGSSWSENSISGPSESDTSESTSSSSASSSSKNYPYGKASATSGNIGVGSTGTSVQAIQWALNQMGCSNSGTTGLDGKFGAKTAEAVKAFQTWMNTYKGYNLSVDGVVGANTRKAFAAMGYALGTRSATPGIHEMYENGDEYTFVAEDGSRYRMFSGGEKVLDAYATSFLYDFANSRGSMFYDSIKSALSSLQNISSARSIGDIRMGDIIIQGNASEKTVSEIRRAQRETVDYMLKEFSRLSR